VQAVLAILSIARADQKNNAKAGASSFVHPA
jgi:hypothetical protein